MRYRFMNTILEFSFLLAFINHMSDEIYEKTSHWFHIHQLETRFLTENNNGQLGHNLLYRALTERSLV
jgi:hypothetical protein